MSEPHFQATGRSHIAKKNSESGFAKGRFFGKRGDWVLSQSVWHILIVNEII